MSLFSPNVGLQCPGPWSGRRVARDSYQVISPAVPVSPGLPFLIPEVPRIPHLGPGLRHLEVRGQGKWSRRRQREGLRGPCPFPVGQTQNVRTSQEKHKSTRSLALVPFLGSHGWVCRVGAGGWGWSLDSADQGFSKNGP